MYGLAYVDSSSWRRGRVRHSPDFASWPKYRPVIMSIEVNPVAGTHRAAKPATAWIWGGMGFVWILLAVMNIPDQHAVRALFDGALGVVWLLLALATTRARTLVDEDGIRVSNGIGGRRIDWDAITSVSKPDRWDPQPTLTVTTDAGKAVLTHVPKPLRKEFIEYANAYRSFRLPALE